MRFPLGVIQMSWAAVTALAATRTALHTLLTRHTFGDAGVASSGDAAKAIREGGVVSSAYQIPGSELSVEIHTGPDRRSTVLVVITEDGDAL